MLRGARSQRAIARFARIAALAASVGLVTAPLSAEPAGNGNGWHLVGNGAGAGTMDAALVSAYQSNPQLNSQRAATRAIDENVPTAPPGLRPRAAAPGSLTEQFLDPPTGQGTAPRPGGAVYTQAVGGFAAQS